jgi:hypothetical protein
MLRDVNDFRVSKSSLSAFEEPKSCRLKWYHRDVVKSIERSPPSEQMIKGTYFELLAIGENVGGDEVPDISFMINANGKPKVELTRIEEQAERFKELHDPNHKDFIGFTIKETQIQMEDDMTKGVADYLTEDEFGRDVMFDLKFTSDVDNTFGDYAWGRDPYEIDWTQQVLYKRLFKKLRGHDPKMGVLVFDASPRKGIKMFDLKISQDTEDDVMYRVETAFLAAHKYSEEGAPVTPSISNCSTCPLDCMFRAKPATVSKTKVSI